MLRCSSSGLVGWYVDAFYQNRSILRQMEWYLLTKPAYMLRYRQKDEEVLLMKRGVKVVFNTALYTFLWVTGFIVIYTQDYYFFHGSEDYKIELETVMQKLEKSDLMIQALLELDERNVREVAQNMTAVMEPFHKIEPTIVFSETFDYRLRIIAAQQEDSLAAIRHRFAHLCDDIAADRDSLDGYQGE